MRYVRIASMTSLLLPKFVDALLGMCVFFSGTSLVCSGALWLPWTAYVVPPLGGGEGWVGRTLDAFVDALGARKEVLGVQGAVGGQGCRI